jgi:serine/threonine protein kinase/outer membrane protein assembly factor BamB
MITLNRFLECLQKSKLLADDVYESIRKKTMTPGADPRLLVQGLMQDGKITHWQARQILAGRFGFTLGKYVLLDCIGKGGMGVVFKARHAFMDRIVALKIMSPALLRKPKAVARFEREVKTAAALDHQNIIRAFDADSVGSTHFLVMEFVEGRDLNFWLKQIGRLPVPVACEVIMQAAQGLEHAHSMQMVHRDIKPVNLLITWPKDSSKPVVKILDMGLARFLSETKEEGTLTRAGQTIGTPDYIAPEAAQSFKDADIRADVFSLGCSLYKALTARLPFEGDNVMAKLLARTTNDAPLIRSVRKDVPIGLEGVVAKMLARDPADRYQTPADVVDALAPFAASTSDELDSLSILRYVPDLDTTRTGLDAMEPDEDATLIEFLREIGLEGETANVPVPDELDLAPLDDSPKSSPKPALTDTPSKSPRQAPAPAAELPKTSPAKKEPPRTSASSSVRGPGSTVRTTKPAPPPRASGPELLSAADVVGDAIDDLQVVGNLAQAAPDPFAALPKERKKFKSSAGKPGKKDGKKSIWDTPLIVFGGGLLLFIVIALAFLVYNLSRESAQQLYDVARQSDEGGSYTQAIAQYEEFLKAHASHSLAGQARVELAMARLKQQVSTSSNWSDALKLAKEQITEVSSLSEFGSARPVLANLLPQIAEGLANASLERHDTRLVAETREALVLIDKYVLKNDRPETTLKNIEAILAQAIREIDRGERLKEAVVSMAEFKRTGDVKQAYDTRRTLLKAYPELQADPTLTAALKDVTDSERAIVKVVAEPVASSADEPAAPFKGGVAWAVRSGREAPGVQGQTVMALAGGAWYGLDAATGQLKWRRFVGFDTINARIPVQTPTAGDALVVDSVANEVVRIDMATGRLRWRFPAGTRIVAPPVVQRANCLVATTSGRLYTVSLDDGSAAGYVQFPQPILVSPAMDPQEKSVYVLGERSNLYVLSAESAECREVIYLGHEAGQYPVPPLAFSRYVILCENYTTDEGRLHVFLADEQGLNLQEKQVLAVAGHVTERPVLDGGTLAVTTDRGQISMFKVGSPGEDEPLKLVAERPQVPGDPAARSVAFAGNEVWLTSRDLSRFEFQISVGRLDSSKFIEASDTDDWFIGPLLVSGRVLYHTRQKSKAFGVWVSAVDMDQGKKIWETQLAASLLGGPVVDESTGRVQVMTAGLALFETTLDQIHAGGFAELPAATIRADGTLDPAGRPVVVGPQAVVFATSEQGQKLLIWDREGTPATALKWRPAPSPAACPPVAYGGGLLVPCKTGQVYLLEPRTGKEIARPYQPPIQPGNEFAWRGPLGSVGEEFVLSDGRSKLYRIGLDTSSNPQLVARSEAEIKQPVTSAVASLDHVAYGMTQKGSLTAWQLPDLTEGQSWDLGSPAYLGPARVGNLALVVTTRNELVARDDSQQVPWPPVALEQPPAGLPVPFGDSIIVATVSGDVLRIDAASGKVAASTRTGQALSAGPVVVGNEVLLSGFDGLLFAVPVP